MSAIKRFLDRDSLSTAVVAGALAATALAFVPKGEATDLPPNAGSTFSAPARVLVTLGVGTGRP